MSFYYSLPFAQEYIVLTYIRRILILSSGAMRTVNYVKWLQETKHTHGYSLGSRAAISFTTWALSASNCSSSAKKQKKGQYSAEASIISLDMYYGFIPLSILKSANKRRSLLLFATSILTMSGGLFWFATKSCSTEGRNQ